MVGGEVGGGRGLKFGLGRIGGQSQRLRQGVTIAPNTTSDGA